MDISCVAVMMARRQIILRKMRSPTIRLLLAVYDGMADDLRDEGGVFGVDVTQVLS